MGGGWSGLLVGSTTTEQQNGNDYESRLCCAPPHGRVAGFIIPCRSVGRLSDGRLLLLLLSMGLGCVQWATRAMWAIWFSGRDE